LIRANPHTQARASGAAGSTERSEAARNRPVHTFLLAAASVAISAALTGCSISDCAYYGDPDYRVHCVITGPAPAGGYQ
jgi:hypothetical protein